MFYPGNKRRAAPAALLSLFIASSIAPAIAKSPSVKVTSDTTNQKQLIDDKATDLRLFPVIKAIIADNTTAPVNLVSPIALKWNKYTEQKQSGHLFLFQQLLAQLDIEDLPNGGIRVKGYSNQQLLRILQEAGYELFSDEEAIKTCQEFRLCSGQLKSRLLYISDPKNRDAIGQEAFDNGLRAFQSLISPARYEATYGRFPIDISNIKGSANAVILYFSVALRYKPDLRNKIIAALNKYPENFKILKGSLETLASKDEISSNSYTDWQQLLGSTPTTASSNVPTQQSHSSHTARQSGNKKPASRPQRNTKRSGNQQPANQTQPVPISSASQEKEFVERKSLQGLTVEVRYDKTQNCPDRNIEITLRIPGFYAIQNYQVDGCFQKIQIGNLDNDKQPEAVIDFHTGGNRCCVITFIGDWGDENRLFIHNALVWNTHGYLLKDLNGDNSLEFVSSDGNFAYAFASGAYSGLPISVWKYTNQNQLVNVTRQFPQAIRNNAEEQWRNYEQAKASGGEVEGFLAAYLADMYMLGKADEGWFKVAIVYPGQNKRKYLEYFSGLHNFLIQQEYANGIDFNAIANKLNGSIGGLLSKGNYGAVLRITDAILIISPQYRTAYESTLETFVGLFAINDIRKFLTKELPEISSTLRGIIQKAKEKWQALRGNVTATTHTSFVEKARLLERKTAKDVNTELGKLGYTNPRPYPEGSTVEIFVTKEPMVFYRIHNPMNQRSRWIMTREQLKGLSATEVRQRFAIPGGKYQNPKVSEVHIPANTPIRRGLVNQGKPDEIQYEINYPTNDKIPSNWFKEIPWNFSE